MVTQAEYEAAIEYEVRQELADNDPVVSTITYRRFVSKSKGRRNGKKRVRRNWKEVHLVQYRGGGHNFTQWHLFTFDVYATEILGAHSDAEMLKDRIIERWGY
jgi:hypothetical protein